MNETIDLKALRLEAEMSVNDITVKTGLHHETVRRMEKTGSYLHHNLLKYLEAVGYELVLVKK